MAQNRVDASVNFTAITEELEGFTGSDIKEVRNESISLFNYQPCTKLLPPRDDQMTRALTTNHA